MDLPALNGVNRERQLIDLDRADCEESLYVFLKSAWHVWDSEPWVDGWCIDAICEHLQAVIDGQIRRLIINIPPRCGKTATCAIALPAWTWAQAKRSHTSGPGVKFLYASYRDDLAKDASGYCRAVVESKWYQDRWGHRFTLKDDQNTRARFDNDKGGYRMVTSVESKGSTGYGASIIIIDDANSAKEVESEATINSTIDWFEGTLGTRFNNQKLGACVEIQQRVGERDLTGHIQSKSKGEWCELILPMRFETWRKSYVTTIGWQDPRIDEGDLLWPERFDAEVVKGLEDWMLPWRAAGQLQQRPAPKGGGIIEREWWQLWDSDTFPVLDYVLATLDTAYTEDQMNDPSGMIIWGVFSQLQPQEDRPIEVNRMIRMDQRESPRLIGTQDFRKIPRVIMLYAWEKFLKLHDLVLQTEKMCTKFKVDLLLIENKASGISVQQELRRLFQNSRFGIQMFDPKSQDKVARLNSVAPLFYEQLIFAPSETYEWVNAVISQAERFPKSRHDEFVDCISMGIRHLRESGMICREIEREIELGEAKKFKGREQALYPV